MSTTQCVGSWDPMFDRFGCHATVMLVRPEESGVAVTVEYAHTLGDETGSTRTTADVPSTETRVTVNLSRGSVHDEPATRRGSVVRSRDERSEVGAVRSQMYAVLLASPITPSAAIELEAKFADG